MKYRAWDLLLVFVLVLVNSYVCRGQAGNAVKTQDSGEQDSFKQLEAYMESLESLRHMYRKAAEMAYQGQPEEAQSLLLSQTGVQEGNIWLTRPVQKQYKLKCISQYLKYSYLSDTGHTFLEFENPELGTQYFETIEKKKGELEFGDMINYCQCLIETGQYSKATIKLQGLIDENTASDWKEYINQRIEAIKDMEDGQILNQQACNGIFLNSGISWYKRRLGPVLIYWGCSKDSIDMNTLAQYFDAAEDIYGKTLALNVMYEKATGANDSETAGTTLLTLANIAHQSEQKDKAFELWGQIERRYTQSSAWGKAVYNRALLLKERGEYDEAIQQFRKLLDSSVNDRESDDCIMEAYQNYRPKAQWEIGNCHFSQHQYEKALAAYQTVQHQYPFQTWCGTCRWEYEYRYALYQGICQEYLGHYDEAVKHYFSGLQSLGSDPAVHIRLADLYESTGQISDLLNLLDEVDAHVMKKLMKESGRELSKEDEIKFRRHGPGRIIRRLFEIRKMEQAEDFEGLAALVKTTNTTAGPEELSARRQNWEAIEASKILARHPSETINRLAAKCNQEKVQDDKYIYCAIGLCGTDEAIKALDRVPVPSNYHWQQSMQFAKSIKGQVSRVSYLDKGMTFPEIPKIEQLPKRFAEIDDDVAFEESIPKTMELDLTCPEGTIKSLFKAALVGKKNFYVQCISNNDELLRAFDDLSEMSRKRIFQYKEAESVYLNDTSAEITVTLKDDRRTETIIFVLAKIEGQWFITDFKEVR